jgi:membrane protease YdiL (CAAX protease family)
VISSITVIFIAPISEEIVFRGGLYNALLRSPRNDVPPWQRHILPYILTSLAFAALHLSAGFERIGSIVLITVFSFYLTALRSYTGSIRTSFIAHLSWNTLAAVGLIAQQLLNLG